MDLSGKRLLICEEALENYKGHFYTWIKAIRNINTSAGATVLVAGNKRVDPAIRDELNVHPAYSVNSWSGIYHHPQAWRRYIHVFRHNFWLIRENRRLFKQTGKVDCVVLTAARIYHLIAWYFLCRWYIGKKFDRVVFFILTSEAVYNEDYTQCTFKPSSALIKTVIRSFKRYVDKGSVVFAGDSHVTCKEYETLTQVPFRLFPSPGAGLNSGKRAVPIKDGVPTFTFLGVSVIDKGIDILQQAILKIVKADPSFPAKFVIQWGVKTIGYDGQEIPVSPILRATPQVTILENVLSDDDYKSLLDHADFIVLPYRRVEYFNKISGVAIEAALAGIPMIVTENTWLSWALVEYGAGVTVKDGDVEDLVLKIGYALDHREVMAEEARLRKSVAMEKNSSERYLQTLWL
jgi:glycosyltransferase involved in cell wall biosynthesis